MLQELDAAAKEEQKAKEDAKLAEEKVEKGIVPRSGGTPSAPPKTGL